MTDQSITQTEIDALWLAARVDIPIGDVPRDLKGRAQLRLQRLGSAGVIDIAIGKYPKIAKQKP